MTTMTPRYVLGGRSADLERLLRPIPQAVAATVGEPAEQHERLAQRFGAARSRAIACRAALDQVEREDAEKGRAAIIAGRALPKSKADADGVQQAGRHYLDAGVVLVIVGRQIAVVALGTIAAAGWGKAALRQSMRP